MVRTITDGWLWFGLGAFTFCAVRGVAYGLREIVRITEVSEPLQDAISIPKASSEDAIKTESLATLATCSNVEIRKAATKILCDRFFRSKEAQRLLVEDFNSSDPERVESATKALKLLEVNGLLTDRYTHSGLEDLPIESDHLQVLPFRGARVRAHGESTEEQELRRRRREAMVINEGDRPVSQDDIIQQGGRMSAEEARVAEQALAILTNRERESPSEENIELHSSQ